MALSRLLFCAASLAVLDFIDRVDATNPSVSFGEELEDCLTGLNVAREAAGLGKLTNPTGEDALNNLKYDQGLGQVICQAVEGKDSTNTSKDNTFAVFALAGEESNPDCNAAVQTWQSGFSIFGQTAPQEAKINDYIKNPKALSFLTLYNPKADKGQCKVATCTTNSEGTDKKYGLVCLSSPSNLSGNPFFSEEEWAKIAKVFSSSTSAALPSLLTFAAVLAGASVS
ncbi:hypothetical protein Emag_001519 [Eimeria magna]